MRTIGLIGGMSWESTIEYYRLINQAVKEKLGGFHSAKCIVYSVDFAAVHHLQHQGRWTEAALLLAAAARSVEQAGADFVLLCTNTMHKLAEEVEAAVRVPLLHIADATAEKILQAGLRRVGLLGTRFTMEQDFYRGRLSRQFGLEVVVPAPSAQDIVHRVIYEELCLGQIRPDSREQLRQIIDQLIRQAAQGIVLGCTELGLLLGAEDSHVPLFDTTRIHALAAVERALS